MSHESAPTPSKHQPKQRVFYRAAASLFRTRVGNRLAKFETTAAGTTETTYVYDRNDKLLREFVSTSDPQALAPEARKEYYASMPPKPRRWAGVALASIAALSLAALCAPLLLPWRRKQSRDREGAEAGNTPRRRKQSRDCEGAEGGESYRRPGCHAHARVGMGKRARRKRLFIACIATFLAPLMAVDPQTVHAMYAEAMAYQAMTAAGVGQSCPVGSGTVEYCYDANGSLSKRYENSQLIATYTFDAENRLIRYTPTTGDPAAYTYDADGIRNSKTVGSDATWHLTDKNQPYAQVLTETTVATGALLVRYVYGDDLISQHRPASTGTRYYHYDGQMSTRALTDGASGVAVTDAYAYDAFGNGLANAGSTVNAYRYTGEQFDDALGHYYLRARYYDQSAGRFLSRDNYPGRQQDPVTLHRYTYCGNSPLDRADPSGRYWGTVATVAIAAFLVAAFVLYIAGPALEATWNVIFSQSASSWRNEFDASVSGLPMFIGPGAGNGWPNTPAGIIKEYKEDIKSIARQKGIPEELLATIILAEMMHYNWLDLVGDHLPGDHSIGITQVRVSTVLEHAAMEPDLFPRFLTAELVEELLLAPRHAIRLLACEVKYQARINAKNLGDWNSGNEATRERMAIDFVQAKDDYMGGENPVFGRNVGLRAYKAIKRYRLLD